MAQVPAGAVISYVLWGVVGVFVVLVDRSVRRTLGRNNSRAYKVEKVCVQFAYLAFGGGFMTAVAFGNWLTTQGYVDLKNGQRHYTGASVHVQDIVFMGCLCAMAVGVILFVAAKLVRMFRAVDAQNPLITAANIFD